MARQLVNARTRRPPARPSVPVPTVPVPTVEELLRSDPRAKTWATCAGQCGWPVNPAGAVTIDGIVYHPNCASAREED
jgi:hypothetical protein